MAVCEKKRESWLEIRGSSTRTANDSHANSPSRVFLFLSGPFHWKFPCFLGWVNTRKKKPWHSDLSVTRLTLWVGAVLLLLNTSQPTRHPTAETPTTERSERLKTNPREILPSPTRLPTPTKTVFASQADETAFHVK